MRRPTIPGLVVLALLVAGCSRDQAPASAAQAPADPSAPYAVSTWPLPSTTGAAQPDLVATPDGRVLLAWVSSIEGRRKALQFVSLAPNGHWQSAPRTIAVGNSLLASWADPPHLLATPDGAMWVQWAQQPAGGGMASDIMIARSTDGGFNWSAPALVNTDGTATEHGFAALWAQGPDRLGIAWLDGRAKAAPHAGDAAAGVHDDGMHDEGMHGKGLPDEGADAGDGKPAGMAMHADEGDMQLRAAFFDRTLRRADETVLDPRTCDCCTTAAAVTARGPLVAYRDRSPDEIRDISVVRFDNDAWTAPAPVDPDGWRMPGCPVNGPAVAAAGANVLVGWYTAAGDAPGVRLALSRDAGAGFGKPLRVDDGEAVQGRVDVALDAQQAWVLWLREDGDGQALWLARYAPDLSRQLQELKVADLQGRGRATGYPQLAVRDGRAYVVWTDVVDGATALHGAVVAPAPKGG